MAEATSGLQVYPKHSLSRVGLFIRNNLLRSAEHLSILGFKYARPELSEQFFRLIHSKLAERLLPLSTGAGGCLIGLACL